MALTEFGSICVEEDKARDTVTTAWIGKHVQISVSISSHSIQEPIFLCKPSLRALVASLVDALELLATKSKAQMKIKFVEIETSVKSKLIQFSPLLVNVALARNQYWNLKIGVSKKKKKKKKKTTKRSKMSVDAVFTNTKESPYWFAGSLGRTLQRSSSFWLQ